jgi:hypothetical protein
MPSRFFERIGDDKDIGKRMREVPLHDLDERFRVMDKFPDDAGRAERPARRVHPIGR